LKARFSGKPLRDQLVVPSLILPRSWVKLLLSLEYVAESQRNLEYVLIVHETGPRKK